MGGLGRKREGREGRKKGRERWEREGRKCRVPPPTLE